MREYFRTDFEIILKECFSEHDLHPSGGIASFLRISDEGVFYDDRLIPGELRWKPAYELDGPTRRRSSGPALPFPFSSAELAAFMLGGWGFFIQDALGAWDVGPSVRVDLRWSGESRDAGEALNEAYRALAAAAKAITIKPMVTLQGKAMQLADLIEAENEVANNFEENPASPPPENDDKRPKGVFDHDISNEEASNRRRIAKKSTTKMRRRFRRLDATVRANYTAWRKAMVCQLLAPVAVGRMDEIPAPSPALTKGRSGDLVDTAILAVQEQCKDPWDANEIWLGLTDMAAAKQRPFLGIIESGLQWRVADEIPPVLTMKKLRQRLAHKAKRLKQRSTNSRQAKGSGAD